MRNRVFCKTQTKGIESFYLLSGDRTYYLFSQKYRRGVHFFYRNGVHLNDAMDFSRAHRDGAIARTMRKLPMYIRHLEKEMNIEILEKTKRKNAA